MISLVWVAKAKGGGRKRGAGQTHARLGKLTDDMAPVVRGDLKRGLETFRDNVRGGDLEKAFRTGKMDSIMGAVPWDELPQKLDKAFNRVLQAGQKSAKGAIQELPGPQQPPVPMILDRTERKLSSFAVSRKGVIAQASKDGTHEAVRRELLLARQQKMTPNQLAENVRQVIGLNARQAVAVSNYRASLGQVIRDPETGKKLRDAVPPRQRDSMVQAQTDRMLDVRADNIARTELRFATNEAQNEAWRAAADDEVIPDGSGRKWVVDGNPCKDLCIPMNGIVVGLDEMWTLPDGREVDNPTEAHPNCECVAVLSMG